MIMRLTPTSVVLVTIAGLGCTTAGRRSTPALSAPRPGEVPVVYYLRFENQPPLTSAQVERLLALTDPDCPRGQRVWFIYVTANWEREGRLLAHACVYFTPESRGPRLRKGRCRPVDEGLLDLFRDLSDLTEVLEPARSLPMTEEYWQVSRADRPFGGHLDTPGLDELPFPAPCDFTEDEVVRLVDFVRTNPAQPINDSGAIWVTSRLDVSVPVYSISRCGSRVEVRTGAIQGLCAGHGEMLECIEEEDGTFRVLGIGRWDS